MNKSDKYIKNTYQIFTCTCTVLILLWKTKLNAQNKKQIYADDSTSIKYRKTKTGQYYMGNIQRFGYTMLLRVKKINIIYF